MERGSFLFQDHITTLESTIDRIRPYVYKVLLERWKEKPKPKVIQGVDPLISRIGLIVDSTTIQVNRPVGRFEDSKKYWDEKNGIYGIKKEVGIMGTPPYTALFISRGEVGSTHDFNIFKNNISTYTQYLKDGNSFYDLCADKAYLGANVTTPFKRICPKKKNMDGYSPNENEIISKARVYVECFFGRMKKLYKISHDVYRFDHRNFDKDINICVLLTNEDIAINHLKFEDAEFYRQTLNEREEALNEKTKKRKISYERTKQKRRRINESYDFVEDVEDNLEI